LFEIKDKDLAARIGKLTTKSGTLETPYLFPVINPDPKKQTVSLDRLIEIGFKGIILSAYILKKRIKVVEDVHSYLKFPHVIATDSGAYQLMRYGNIDVSNEEIVRFQCSINTDIGVILDVPTGSAASYEEAMHTVEETLRRALEVQDLIQSCKTTLWVLPIQGGRYLDLLFYSVKRSRLLSGYSIYAVGSPTRLLEEYKLEDIIDMIATVRMHTPLNVPIHLFGAGHPLIIPFAVALGVDLMDSASYILYARDNRYMTRRGTYRLEELEYFPCSCPVCSRYEPRDLLEMDRNMRVSLLAEHNLYVIMEELKAVKQAIKEKRLWEYLEEVSMRHHAARRAFERLKRYLPFIYERSPSHLLASKATLILSSDSVYNPKIVLARRSAMKIFVNEHIISGKELIIKLIPAELIRNTELYADIAQKLHSYLQPNNSTIYLYERALGLIPYNALRAYPYSQHEIGAANNQGLVANLANIVLEHIIAKSVSSNNFAVFVYYCSKIPWSKAFSETLINTYRLLLQKLKLKPTIHVDDICDHSKKWEPADYVTVRR